MKSWLMVSALAGVSVLLACSSNDGSDSANLGKGGASAGRSGTGSFVASGGNFASGGSVFGNGGRLETGGTLSNGGRSAGGATASGGRIASGGAIATGGGLTSGGTFATGGTRASGGRWSGWGGFSFGQGGSQLSSGGVASTGGRQGTGGVTASGGSATAGASSGSQPRLPDVNGTCPNFVTGTSTIAGLSGISLQVGAKQQGTGSLLFYWHGTGSTAAEVNTLIPSSVRQAILAEGGIIVSFQQSSGTGGDCSGTATFSKDDFQIADLIAACAVRDYGIDSRRIYTTGCSAGGLQAGCMGALRSSYIAAAVPNSGGEVTQLAIQDSAHTPAVMTLHGGAADMVGVSFSTTSAAYDKQMKNAGSFVVNCDHGGGHCQAPAALYSAAWEFMKAHPFGVEPEPYSGSLPASFPTYCSTY